MAKLTVERKATARVPTAEGEYRLCLYHNSLDAKEHLALVMGEVSGESEVLVRVHSECLTGDVLGSQRCDCGEQLHRAMRQIGRQGAGVIVYLRQEGRGIGLANKIRAYALQEAGCDTVEANARLGFPADLRDYRAAIRMLQDLGVRSTRLMSNNPRKLAGITGEGLSVSERLPIEILANAANERYLKTKKDKLGHLLSSV